jgi:hypothetical protein
MNKEKHRRHKQSEELSVGRDEETKEREEETKERE